MAAGKEGQEEKGIGCGKRGIGRWDWVGKRVILESLERRSGMLQNQSFAGRDQKWGTPGDTNTSLPYRSRSASKPAKKTSS